MSNDLISRSALIKRFKQLQGVDNLANMLISDVINEVKKQPTAYNLDAVKDELKENLEDSDNAWSLFGSEEALGKWSAYRKSVEIVEKGGVDG